MRKKMKIDTEANRKNFIHYNMSHIRSKGTKPELILRKLLWKNKIRYRKNYKLLPGIPDIVLTRYKIAIFVDGDFWHARYHKEHPGEQMKSNKAYWTQKLKNNVDRDIEVNEQLLKLGWLVLRFWGTDVEKNPEKCLAEIKKYVIPKDFKVK